MGNTCENDICFNPDENIRERNRSRLTSVHSEANIQLKDLVKLKKYPITDDYTLVYPPVGNGSFGSVYKIINRSSGRILAAKRISRRNNLAKNLQQISILRRLDHPNIIRIIDVYEWQSDIYVVMEFCEGGELFERIVQRKEMGESHVRHFMEQLISTVAYCHQNRVMHRDLKPENIMFHTRKDDQIKIIDFGVGGIIKQGQKYTSKVGSVYYIAPEVIKRSYNEKCDVWSMGIIMYMMLSGSPAFNGKTDQVIFDKILYGRYEFPERKWSVFSEQAKDLISKMLEYDPESRLSARQALNHPWFHVSSTKILKNMISAEELTSIKKFSEMNKFKAFIHTFVLHNISTSESLSKLSAQFSIIDKNKDGKISRVEFESCYEEVDQSVSHYRIGEIFRKLDKNNSGYIDYSEFLISAQSNLLAESQQLIDKAFDLIDTNKNGVIERQQILNALGGIDEATYEQIMRETDSNNDNEISRQEFRNAIFNVSQQQAKKKHQERQNQ